MKQKKSIVLLCALLFTLHGLSAQSKFSFDRYHTPDELMKALASFVSSFPKITKLHKIAVSPGGKAVNFIEIGSEINKKKKDLPAVFVVANMEGTVPLSSEAAIHLIQSDDVYFRWKKLRKDNQNEKNTSFYHSSFYHFSGFGPFVDECLPKQKSYN